MRSIKRRGTTLKRGSADSQASKRRAPPALANNIPNPRTSNKTFSVSDGGIAAGHVLKDGTEYFAYDADFVFAARVRGPDRSSARDP
jgi:hypothetical protein